MTDLTFIVQVLAAVTTAGGSSIVTYLMVRRAKSGRINSSEADVLWQESTAIRRELREQVQHLELNISANEVEIAALHAENAALKHEVLTLRTENAVLKVQVDKLSVENIELRAAQKAQSHERGSTLEGKT